MIKHTMNKKLTVLLLLMLAGFSLFAQDSVALKLEKAVDLGLQNSKQLKISQARVDQAIAQFKQAKEARLPDVKISSSALLLNHPQIDMKTGGSGNGQSEMAAPSSAVYGMATATLPLYAGSKIKNGIDAAKYLQEAVKFDAENDREKIILNIINAYTTLYKAQASVKLVQENLKQSQQRDKDLANLEKNGLLARNDLLKAQLQTSNIELALVNAENDLKLANVALNLITGLPEKTKLQIDTAGMNLKDELKGIDVYEQQALVNRKDVKALWLRHDAASAKVKQAKGEYFPNIGLTGGYIAADIPKVLTITNAVNAGVGVQYNLGSLWKTKSRVEEAKAASREISAMQEMMADDIRLEIHEAYEAYFSAKKKIDVQRAAVENAKENYRITKNKYDNNLVNTTELLDADTALLEAEINLATAKADIFSAYHALLQRSGMLSFKYTK